MVWLPTKTKTDDVFDDNITTRKTKSTLSKLKNGQKSMTKKIKTFIKESEDKECLEVFLDFLQERVTLSNHFVTDDDGISRGQVLIGTCGDNMFTSKPFPLEWPMKALTAEEAVGKNNVN